MADFEAPSFSLGFDFDTLDSEPHNTTANEDNKDPSSSNQFAVASTTIEDDDNDFGTITVADSDSENQGSPPKLKRLRRGSAVDGTSSAAWVKSKVDLHSPVDVDDEDIEEFSSPEDNRTDEHISTQHHFFHSSSKFPLNGTGVLTKQSGKRKQSVSSGPESVITRCNNPLLPRITISPLRRFQLIDSDSDYDDPSVSEYADNGIFNGPESYLNRGQSNLTQNVGFNERKLNEPINRTTMNGPWEDFRPEKRFHIPTPALDEVCNEYFTSMKDKNKFQSNIGNGNQRNNIAKSIIDLDDPQPPAHLYFFHNDPRVHELVRTRLPNFFPLSNTTDRNSKQPSSSNIDYMGQFNHGENSKQAAKKPRTNKPEKNTRKNSRKSKTVEISQGLMNPKLDIEKGIPKDAGKRRVQAAGHWYTGPDGRRVYVTRDGKELTGRAAYTLYRKESGKGFKNTNAKKKASIKKK